MFHIGSDDREGITCQQQKGMMGVSQKKGGYSTSEDASVFVRQENRKLASHKHNILLLIFPAWLPSNPTLPSNSPIWKPPPPPPLDQ